MSSCVMTKIAATCDIFCSFFEPEVTSRFSRSSILTCVRSPGRDCGTGEDCGACCDGGACPPATPHPTRKSKTVAPDAPTRSGLFDRFPPMPNTSLFPGSYPHATRQCRENHRPYLSCNQRFVVLELAMEFQRLVIREFEGQIGTTVLSSLAGSSPSPRVTQWHAAALSG